MRFASLIAIASLAVGCRATNVSSSIDPKATSTIESARVAPTEVPDVAGSSSTTGARFAVSSETMTKKASTVAHVAFVGDVALALHVKSYLEGASIAVPPLEAGYPFGSVRERLRGYDLLVGNLECVIASRGSPRRAIPLNAPLDAPSVLLDAGFDVVSVANNHALDLGFLGYSEMLGRLDQAGIAVAGDHLVHVKNEPSVVREINGIKIAIVGNYNRDHDLALRDVRFAKEHADVVLVFEHWGDDFVLTPERFQRVRGRELIDAGADAVIGTHAHVVQPEETYAGKLIVHGLGNFVFSGMTLPGTRVGALVELDISRSGVVQHRYRKVVIDERGSPTFADGDAATAEPSLDPPGPRPLPELTRADHF